MQAIKVVEIVATIIGAVGQIGYFPQTYKIIKNKSVQNVSILTYFIWMTSIMTWLIYGMLLKNIPLIVTNIFAVIGCSSVIAAYLIYKNADNGSENLTVGNLKEVTEVTIE